MNNKKSSQQHQDIKVPPLGESITEATLLRWLKKQGDAVIIDEPLVEVETDKVTIEIGSPATGILTEVLVPQGETVEIGTIIGRVQEGAQELSQKETPQEKLQAKPTRTPSPQVSKATPPLQVNLQQTKDTRVERVPMSRLRQRIAERLKEAQNTAAILTTFNEADMTNVIALRTHLKESFEKKHGVKLGLMSFFVKACLMALKEIPSVNAEIEGDEIIYKNYYDIGVAVGTPQGLVVPVIREANQKSFAQIEQEISLVSQKAREGRLALHELQGGTFTISNGGVYGSLLSTPILNPPQSGILGMHKIQERPIVVAGKIEIRPMMYLALSYDHRLVDGKEAVTFLVRVKECIENPERFLLDV